MQMGGTSIVASPFCRRASRRSAAGRKTDGAAGSLLSRIGVIIVLRHVRVRVPRGSMTVIGPPSGSTGDIAPRAEPTAVIVLHAGMVILELWPIAVAPRLL